MKKLLLVLGLLCGLTAAAQAQCVAVGGVNSVPQPGINCASEPSVGSYAAAGYGIVPAASATDIACITGSATKVVRVQRVRVSGSGTAISLPVILTYHTVANTGGTPATTTALPVPFKLDTNNVAATATTTAYTANPTVDTSATIIDANQLGVVATTVGAGVTAGVEFNYLGRLYTEAPTLRGVAQQVCVNLTGTSPTASLSVSFLWTEAPQ